MWLSTHVHPYQCQEDSDLVVESLETLDIHMSHLHRKFGVTQFVQDPEVLGEIHTMLSLHVHQLGTEKIILQRC